MFLRKQIDESTARKPHTIDSAGNDVRRRAKEMKNVLMPLKWEKMNVVDLNCVRRIDDTRLRIYFFVFLWFAIWMWRRTRHPDMRTLQIDQIHNRNAMIYNTQI